MALHQKSGSDARGGSSILNKPPPLAVACNFGAKPVSVMNQTLNPSPVGHENEDVMRARTKSSEEAVDEARYALERALHCADRIRRKEGATT